MYYCMYLFIYIHVYIYTIYIHTDIEIYMYMQKCMHTCIFTHINVECNDRMNE